MIPAEEILLRFIIAALFGGFIGFERERKGRPAGLRTHILVCVASAMMVVFSIELFAFEGASLSRVIAGILTGIGFIGAGTIMKQDDHVEGLTTAASVWVVAAIGMGVGLGFYIYSLWATVLVLLVLLLSGFEKKMREVKKLK